MKKLDRRSFIKWSALTGAGLSLGMHSAYADRKEGSLQGKRVGIIGLDTSHSVAFTKSLNTNASNSEFLGYKVVAAYPQGSKDIQSSVDRVPKYTEDVISHGVEIVDSIESLMDKVDVILLESNDGRVHLEQAIPVLKARKRLFIDKPIAASYKDAKAIFDLAEKHKTPLFSSSSLRYIEGLDKVLAGDIGEVLGAHTYSPAHLEATHPDMFWYGIHGIEMLFAIMGTGCESVTRIHEDDVDVLVGKWKDGRIGTFRGSRTGKSDYGGTVFGKKANLKLGSFKGYDPLLKEIVKFFDTGIVPVNPQETLEICAFIEAADQSKMNQGSSVQLETFNK